MESEKDFKKYAYFRSKAKNYAVCIKPERKAIVDGEVVIKDPGLRVEFDNGMKRIEKTEEGMVIINFLRERIKTEEPLGVSQKSLFEEVEQEAMIPESKVAEILLSKNAEIDDLKQKLAEKGEPANVNKKPETTSDSSGPATTPSRQAE